MKRLLSALNELLQSGKDAMLVSVFAVSGSAPRGAGAKMLVCEQGRIFGTIGGGSVEHEAELHAIGLLKEKSSDTQSFRLAPNKIKDLGMVCGGEAAIYFQYIAAVDLTVAALIKTSLSKIEGGEESWLVTCLAGAAAGQMGLYGAKDGFTGIDNVSSLSFTDKPDKQAVNGAEYLVEPLIRPGTVCVFGGGHVSQAFVPLAASVGFRCAVFDDRDEFTNPKLFPGAIKTVKLDFNDISKAVSITKNDYVVIMTRGHQYDSALQAQAMRTRARYIGVIGSKSKIAHVSRQMRGLGFTDADLARVKTPIGLDIGAETPEEIAVSITAELIMVRAGKGFAFR